MRSGWVVGNPSLTGLWKGCAWSRHNLGSQAHCARGPGRR